MCVGNRLSNYRANLARQRPTRPTPHELRELPLAECENQLSMWESNGGGPMIIDDVRRVALTQLKFSALTRWSAKSDDRSFMACSGMLDLARAVLLHGSSELQATLVHVATNSIDFHWLHRVGQNASLEQLSCPVCSQVFTIGHVVTCPAPCGVAFRAGLRRDLLALFAPLACTTVWMRANGHRNLQLQLLSLFPPSPAATPLEQHRHLIFITCGALLLPACSVLQALKMASQPSSRCASSA